MLLSLTLLIGIQLIDTSIASNSNNSSLPKQWRRTWGVSLYEEGKAVTVDSVGNVYMTGSINKFSTTVYDAFLAKYDASGTQLWNKTWGGDNNDLANGVAVDSLGNVYIVGSTNSFGNGAYDVFIVKYDSSGSQLWSNIWGGDDDDTGYGVAIDSTGNIYITGGTRSDAQGYSNAFLVKYDASGTQLWSTTWGGNLWNRALGVATDSTGKIYITGWTGSFDQENLDVFLVKYDSLGLQHWNTTWGGSDLDIAYGIALDSADSIYITGQTRSSDIGGSDAFIVKYDSTSTQLWNTTWGTTYEERGYGLAINSSGEVYMVGYTQNFNTDDTGVFIAKYNNVGTQIWNTTWSSSGNQEFGWDVALGLSGSIYVTGVSSDDSAGGPNAFLTKFGVTGTPIWEITWGPSNDNEYGQAVTVDSSGNVYITGYTTSFGMGGLDAFLVKYDRSGSQLWNTTWGFNGDDYGMGVAVDSSGNVYMTGYTDVFGSNDTYLVKYNSSGTWLWYTFWGGPGNEYGMDLAVDSNGSIYITGHTTSYGLGDSDIFLVKFNLLTAEVWNKVWGGVGDDIAYGLALDSEEDICITGTTENFGAGDLDIIVIKYNSSGTRLWNTTWGGTNNDYSYDIALNTEDNLFLVGATGSFGAENLDVLLVSYTSSGTQLWNTTWGSGSLKDDFGYGIAISSANEIYITGYAYSNAFLVNYDDSGIQKHIESWRRGPEYGRGVAVDSLENVYVIGRTRNSDGDYDAFLNKFAKPSTPSIAGYSIWLILGLLSLIIFNKIKKTNNQ